MAEAHRKDDDAFCFINVTFGSSSTVPNVSQEALGMVRSHAMKSVRRRPLDEQKQDASHSATNVQGVWPANDRHVRGGPRSPASRLSGVSAAYVDGRNDDRPPQHTAVDQRDEVRSMETRQDVYSTHSRSVYRTALAAACHYSFLWENMAQMSYDLTVNISANTAGQTILEKMVGDSLRLLHCGRSNNDERIVLEARKRQLVGVQLLKLEVQRLRDPSSVLSAAQMLLLSELYSDTSEDSENWKPWHAHLHAMAVVIKQSDASRTTSSLRPFLLHQYRHSSLMYSLVNRVCAIDEEAWDICSSYGSLLVAVEELFQLAKRLIKLLECIDACSLQILSNTEAADLCTRTSQWRDVDNDYERWLLRFERAIATSPDENHVLKAVGSAEKRFDRLTASPFLEATCRSFYWTCLLILRQSLFEHWVQHHEEFNHPIIRTKIDLCAKRLRGLIEHHLQTRDGLLSKVLATGAPLHFLSRWYALSRNASGLLWCKEQETELRAEAPFVNWNAALLWSFLPLHCLA